MTSFDLPASRDQNIAASAVIEFDPSDTDEPLVPILRNRQKRSASSVNGQQSDYRFESSIL